MKSATDWPVETRSSVPARAASFQADVLVPMGQSLITGVLGGTALAVMAVAIMPDLNKGATWLFCVLGTVTLCWFVLLVSHRRLLWAVERLTHKDLDHDGSVGQPPVQTINVQVQDGGTTRFVDGKWLGMSDAELVAMADAICKGRKLTEGAWAYDKIAFPRGLLKFRDVRTKLVVAGLVRRTSEAKNASFELTAAGRAGFQAINEYAE